MSKPEIKLWIRRPKNFGRIGLESLDNKLDEISFEKPLLFCLGGVRTAHENKANINGFAKAAESLLGGEGIYPKGVQLISASYDPISRDDTIKNYVNSLRHTYKSLIARDRFFVPIAEPYADSLVQKVFAREGVIPDLHALHSPEREEALAECQRKMSHVSFMGHSMGTNIIPFIHDKLCTLMEDRGFTEPEIAKTLRAVHVVNFGDTGLWYFQAMRSWKDHNATHQPWYFTSLHFVSTNDKQTASLSDIAPELLAKHGKRDLIVRLGNEGNVMLFLSRIPYEKDLFKVNGDAGKGEFSPIVTMHSMARDKLKNAKVKGVKRLKDKVFLEAKLLAEDLSVGAGHGAKLYTGEADCARDPYVSDQSGWMLVPSALKSALRNAVLNPSHNGNGDPSALLATAEPLDSTAPSADGNHTYWPALEAYPYSKRINELLAESIHVSELPSRTAHAWSHLLNAELAEKTSANGLSV